METPQNRTYIAIDLKSFYASVECVARGLDPLGVNLVVADPSRTEKTICLAVSPSLKAFGIPGRARLFEVNERVSQVNGARRLKAPEKKFCGKSYYAKELEKNPALELDFITAPPHMARYMEVSTQIYSIYLKYVAPEDIHIYSVDEVFIDATAYLGTYKLSPREFAAMLIHEVLYETGITATAGIGTNLYLCKIAMDIVAKHIPADKDGVRIAELDETSYRRLLWAHTPLTDFWRIGKGYADKLEKCGLNTMGDIARASLCPSEEAFLYKLFGVNAELLIDHSWGYEPCTIADIKSYRPESNSISSGQVLQCAYSNQKARIVIREMADALSLDLVAKGLVTDQIVLTVGYDKENCGYKGESTIDRYGRKIPKPAHGSINLSCQTASSRLIIDAVSNLFDRITDPALSIRRMCIAANHVVREDSIIDEEEDAVQLDFFTDYEQTERQKALERQRFQRERSMQKALLEIKRKYGKNAVLKGMNFEEGATARQRNEQVGGHKA
ncbi:MAG: DNA methylase [Oscillospiraceae bacterium]